MATKIRKHRLMRLTDLRRFMAAKVNQLNAGEIDTDTARAFGYLCSCLKDIIKESDIESRVKELETQLAERDAATTGNGRRTYR